MMLSQHTCHDTCHSLPVALAGKASTSFRLHHRVNSSVSKDLTRMNLSASEAATPPPSTVHRSERRAFHFLTYPRDGTYRPITQQDLISGEASCHCVGRP